MSQPSRQTEDVLSFYKDDVPKNCDWAGCSESGEHRAPISRDNLREFHWFCLDHVRIYNRAWNYYEGLTETEVEAAVRSDTTWNRPTWPLGTSPGEKNGSEFPGFGIDDIADPFGFMGADGTQQDTPPKSPLASERRALSVLGMDYPITEGELKTRYKELVKRHHPDANGGDKDAEERFKRINEAYETLMTAYVS